MADKANKPIFVYVATYANVDDAKADYNGVKQLYYDGVIGVFDAAVVSKDATGKVKIHETEMPTQYGAWGGLAVGAAEAGVMLLEAYVRGKLEEKEINKGIESAWPRVVEQIRAMSAEIDALKAKPDTQKIYAVIDVKILRARLFSPHGYSESIAQVESVIASKVSTTAINVEPHDEKVEGGVLMDLFNHRTAFTYSIPIWDRAQEQAEAQRRKTAQMIRKLMQDAPKKQAAQSPVQPPDQKPELLPTLGAKPPQPTINLLPGAPGPSPRRQEEQHAAAFRAKTLDLISRGQQLLSKSPTAEEIASFKHAEEMWRIAAMLSLDYYKEKGPDTGVRDFDELLNSDQYGGRLKQIRGTFGD